MKRCARCRLEKPLELFGNSKSRRDGKHPYCKDCRSNEAQNPERKKVWYKENRDKTIARVKARHDQDREARRAYAREHYSRNKEAYFNCVVKWQKDHPHIMAWRRVLRNSLKALCRVKSDATMEMLGYSAASLKSHIESLWTPGMTWENYGEWHIDHIRPLNSFEPNADVAEVNALSNLRPLWSTTRVIDNVSYEGNLNRTKRWKPN